MLWSKENFDKLTAYQKSLFDRAFTTNAGDPDYLSLDTLTYEDKGIKHKVPIPKGDVLHQFRKDVDTGNLPAVSWIIPSQKLSDHPSAPWYGTWYTSEILDILTKNPEVWKKTIFILTYDENDGYFDHVVPFIPPLPNDPETGKCSEGIDTSAEYIKLENELAEGIHKKEARGGPIGLGYRVPMIIASPWSRGGKVCSQVLDHTSVIQFLEVFLNKKFQKDIRQTEITAWRRAISGNMTAAFSRYDGREIAHLPFIRRDPFIEGIYDAQFTGEPTSYKKLTAQEIEEINKTPLSAKWLPKQEPGIRTACPLPYQLYAHSGLTPDKRNIRLSLKASDAAFGKDAAGAPFNVYAANRYAANPDKPDIKEPGHIWHFAVKAGDTVSYQWPVQNFEGNQYDLEVHGPNGFYRRIAGSQDEMPLEVICEYQRDAASRSRLTGNIDLKISNKSKTNRAEIRITDNRYGREPLLKTIAPGKTESILINLKKSHNWYDFSVILPGFKSFLRQYAGRVETGDETRSDPYMGSVKV